MSTQKLDAEILRFLPLLGKDEKSSLLSVIKSFLSLKESRADGEDEFDIEEYNRDIDEGETESERDGFISQEEVEMQVASWKQRSIV